MTTSPGDQQPAVTVRSRPIPKVLVGQKALVTGANSGIGRAVAVALGQSGADVVVNYVVGEDAAEQVVGEIRKCGSIAYARKADVSQEDQVQEMFRSVVAQFGTIDILVNNARLQGWGVCGQRSASRDRAA
jgi:glucose 1-dehydrogenase